MQRRNKKKSQFSIVCKRLLKNKTAVLGLVIIILLCLVAIFAEQLMPYDYAYQDYYALFQKPNKTHLLGTDHLGRDMLSRLIYGCRISLEIGLASVIVSALIGGILGSIAGYYGGAVDNIIMCFLDIYQSAPAFVLALAMAAVFGYGVPMTILAMGISGMSGYARMIRGSIMTIKGAEYIEAARAVKGNDFHIIMKHIIPNAISPMIVNMSMGIGNVILMVSMLGFVGMGVPAPTPEWGAMLSAAKNYMREYGYLVIEPGIAIVITVMAFNLFGDGLRDALDPKLKD